MRILHTSDWHLGRSDAEHSLIDDQRFFIDAIADIIREKNIDAVIVAGDVFDRSVASTEAIRLYDYAMRRMCIELKKKALVIAGNHDGAARLSSCRDLLSAAGLYVCGALTAQPQKAEFDDVEIYMLPWITEEKVKSVYPEEADAVGSLEDAYRTVTRHMRETFTPGKRHIVAAHAFITKAETSTSDLAAEIGLATQVGAGVFDGFDYAALGHIHKPQDVGGIARYSGTPMPYSFGKEETQQKSVTLIDTADMSREILPLPLLHRRATLKGAMESLLSAPCDEETRLGYVKLEITDQYADAEAAFALRAVYPNMLEFSGLTFDDANASITLTAEELEEMETDPTEVFRRFCMEVIKMEPDEHLTDLFRAALAAPQEDDA